MTSGTHRVGFTIPQYNGSANDTVAMALVLAGAGTYANIASMQMSIAS